MKYGNVNAGEHDADFVRKSFWAKLSAAFGCIPFARDVIALYYFMQDCSVSIAERSAGIFGLLYFVNPADVMCDLTPLVGYADDAVVIAAVVAYYGEKLLPYTNKADEFLRKISKQ